MTDSSVYTRVPNDVKQRIADFRTSTNARSDAAAIAALLVAGLDAAVLAERVENLTGEVDELKQKLTEETAARTLAEQRHAALESAVQAWTGRAEQRVARCPECRRDVTGTDLIVSGTCPFCRHSLTVLLEKPESGDAQRDNILMLLAAAGVVLGLVAISRKGS